MTNKPKNGSATDSSELSGYTLGDYDIWYKPCSHCGYDTGKSSTLEERCWKCGRRISRDYSERALKKKRV